MAAAGGHWVKAAGGPYAGKSVFMPALKEKTISYEGHSYSGYAMGSAFMYQMQDGKWQTAFYEHGQWWDAGVYSSKQLAKGKLQNMSAAGVGKAANEAKSMSMQEVSYFKHQGGVVKKGTPAQEAFNPTPKTYNKAKAPVEGAPAPKTAKAETAGAEAQVKASAGGLKSQAGESLSTNADFEASKGNVEITTIMGNKEVVQGVMIGDGSLGVTYNTKTGQYHLIDGVSGKTISKHATAEEAFQGAKDEQKSMVSIKAPENAKFTPFESAYKGEQVMSEGYAKTKLSYDEVHAVSTFQGSSSYANDILWSPNPQSTSHIKAMDSVMTKAKLPVDSVLIRGEGKGHPLYDMAKHLDVGNIYPAKGFDCTSLNPDHVWGGNAVKLIYRAPKGIPAVFGYHYTSGFHGEYEVTLGRGLNWKVVGKTVHKGNITLTLEYDSYTPQILQ